MPPGDRPASSELRRALEHRPSGRLTPEQDTLLRAFYDRTGVRVRPGEFGTWETADGIPEDGGTRYLADHRLSSLLRRIEAMLRGRPDKPG